MISAKIDRPKLERSLKRLAKDFGDTNAQAIARWGVQTCRELAVESQVFGKDHKKTKAKQINSIMAGARTIIHFVESLKGRKERCLRTPAEVNKWIESNRGGSRMRTRKVPSAKRHFCTEAVFAAAMKIRSEAAGAPKGAWLGAGMEIAKAQTGAEKINIGKNFLGYTQRHAKWGKSTHPKTGWSPSAKLTNSVPHSASGHVLKSSRARNAINWGLKKTLAWYRRALNAKNKKAP